MDPALTVNAKNLSPDVVFTVPDPSYPAAHCAAKHSKAVCPLSYSASSGLEKHECIIISWESLESLAVSVRALVKLNPGSTSGLLLVDRCNESHRNGSRVAVCALWVVDPLEEVSSEPLHKGNDAAVLISPRGLDVRT